VKGSSWSKPEAGAQPVPASDAEPPVPVADVLLLVVPEEVVVVPEPPVPVPVVVPDVVVVVPLVLLQAAMPARIREETNTAIMRFGNIGKLLSVRRGGRNWVRDE
jgi:hypothetical protein